MNEKSSVVKVLAPRYKKATKKEKRRILDELCMLTGYNRSYASYLLSNHFKKTRIANSTFLQADTTKKMKRTYKKKYGSKVLIALTKIWQIMDFICGKRLAPILSEIIPILEHHHEISLDSSTRQKLLEISSATIDRLLRPARQKLALSTRSKTKPGTLLKGQIPIRTFADWSETRPGFVEIDLVGHDGGDVRGDHLQTLDVTDVHTAWTETRAVRNKAQVWVIEAIKHIKGSLPFQLLGIDSDNGSEFINAHLLAYCQQNKITFTRTRSYRKNDNCFVEQKNYSVVRRAVGYLRYDTEEELEVINQLYTYLRL